MTTTKELTDRDRLRVWAASGVSVTLGPDELRALARCFDIAEKERAAAIETRQIATDAFDRAIKRYNDSQRNLALSVMCTVIASGLLVWAVMV